ncbi:MAG TPA: hypothetical protein VEK79_21930 [Thermoanaerobaculia bacterium]|nr:hypothetical protein [Thermoanaerobaculia bacterium]
MNRRSFGFWGVDLSPSDFAKALAAAGIEGELEKESGVRQLLTWRPPDLDKLRTHDDAREQLARWNAYLSGWGETPRIEIDPGFDTRALVDAAWVHETLSTREVDAASVYIRADEPVAKVVLAWPVRVGVLSTTEASALLDAFRQYHYADKLVTFVTLDESHRECDVFVSPNALRRTVADLAALPFPIRCDLAIVLGATDASARNMMSLISALRTLSRSAGVALAATHASTRLHWFSSFIDEIAHNNPLDVALRAAMPAGDVVMFVASRVLAQWTLSKRVELLRETMEAVAPRDTPLVLPPATTYALNLPESVTFREVTARMSRPETMRWDREADMASASVELSEITAAAMTESPLPEARWIQAQVYGETQELVKHEFRRAAKHEVRVRIAPDDTEWMRGEGVFPDDQLPDDDREHLVTVIFFDPQFMPEPQMGTILLPRRGASSTVSFFFKPDAETVEARITVLYQNRVLQTALVKGSVTNNELPKPDRNIVVVTEAVIRPGMQSLGSMERGDAAIVLNKSAAGEAGALKTGAGRASYVSIEDLKDEIGWFDDELSKIADDPDKYAGLFTPATVNMLVNFAQHGRLLYLHFMDSRDFEKMRDAERIQVVSAKPEARFPIEFVYDRELEPGVSTLCTRAVEALATGKCEHDTLPGDSPGSVICPLGFWGLRKVIERHVHDSSNPIPTGQDFGLQAEPVEGRNKLEVLKCALLGATKKVDAHEPGGIARVQNRLAAIVPATQPAIEKWDVWKSAMCNAPTLLVLLVHVEQEAKLQKMEIGDKEFLGAAFISEKFIREPKSNPPPLVLLMGCETGAPRMSFQGFVSQFRRFGAAAVISSGSTVLGRHVVPVTEELLAQLQSLSAGQSTSIGEAMRAIRRSMLANGLPMVLALTAYGDADWRLA